MMRKLFLMPCVAMLTAAAAPANAAPPAVSTQAAPSEAQQSLILSGGRGAQGVEEKKICKHLPTSGSRLSNRACLTAKEWKQVEDETSR
jgi:hypothetical protein